MGLDKSWMKVHELIGKAFKQVPYDPSFKTAFNNVRTANRVRAREERKEAERVADAAAENERVLRRAEQIDVNPTLAQLARHHRTLPAARVQEINAINWRTWLIQNQAPALPAG